MHLYQALAESVATWRQRGHPHDKFGTIAEILAWCANPEGAGFRLRQPQLHALETYWYLRLVENTPKILALYRSYFPGTRDLLKALGVADDAFRAADYDVTGLLTRVRSDDEFTRRFRFEALRETLSLGYPSYILALAMGTVKTVLIGAIFATEFAMSMEYPDGGFVQNALVFAPGKTIIESLRELAGISYSRILPPRFFK
ncbi:MAG: restriction endonuclease subunit R, partial [Chloroflexota bacterium]|nr:restriction endonuclease subunit R [Chloroflexota bacterium]